MKNIIYIILSVAMFFGGCSWMTDLETTNRRALSNEQALSTVEGFQNILFAAYESVNDFGYYGQTMIIAPEIMGDNLNLVQFTGRYEGQIVFEPRSHISIWGRYVSINECNIVINEVDNSEGDQALKDQLKGEAYFLRALFYHDLARTYGYEPGQEVGGWDAAVILRTDATSRLPNVTDEPRATNVAVYEQIESDLNNAITFLSSYAPGNASRATVGAAYALLSRVYLYWGRYADAATAAADAIANAPAFTEFVSDSAAYMESWDDSANPFNPESFFETEITTVDWSTVDGPNNSLHSLLMNNTTSAQNIIRASSDLVAALQSDPNDIRNNLWIEDAFGYECQKWLGAKGGLPFLENIPIIRYSEVLLNAAEGKARSGDEAGARADIQQLRNARGIAGTVTESGQALIDLILSERRKELAAEGHRFYDQKRLGLPITKSPEQGFGSPTLLYTDYRILSFIPQSELELSDNILVQNPNY